MQLDTGTAISIIPETIYSKFLTRQRLTKTRPIRSYSGEKLDLIGELQVLLKYRSQVLTLPLVVVKGNKLLLLERNWLKHVKLKWSEIFTVHDRSSEKFDKKYNKLFEEGNGTIHHTLLCKKHEANLSESKASVICSQTTS